MKVGRMDEGRMYSQINKEFDMAREKCALGRIAIVEMKMERIFIQKEWR